MPVNGVNHATDSTVSPAARSTDSAMGMSTDDFYKLLIAEMRYQDPMQPMDNAKMVEQVAGIRSIEASTTMASTLQTVTRQQNYATAASLIGKKVTATVQDVSGKDQQITGVVTRVVFNPSGQIVLELDGGANLAPLEAVTDVQNVPAAEAADSQTPDQGLLGNLLAGHKAA